MRCCCYCLLLVLLVPTLTGCAGSSEIAQPPTRLSEINRVLESSDATIVWVSGNRVKDAEYVRLSRDSIRYRLHTDPGGASRWESSRLPESEKTRSRPIEDAQRIEALVGGGGVVSGSAISAIPGGIVIGTSLVSGSELSRATKERKRILSVQLSASDISHLLLGRYGISNRSFSN